MKKSKILLRKPANAKETKAKQTKFGKIPEVSQRLYRRRRQIVGIEASGHRRGRCSAGARSRIALLKEDANNRSQKPATSAKGVTRCRNWILDAGQRKPEKINGQTRNLSLKDNEEIRERFPYNNFQIYYMSINYLLISTKINFQIILPLRFEQINNKFIFLVKLLKQPFQLSKSDVPIIFQITKKGRRYKLEINIDKWASTFFIVYL